MATHFSKWNKNWKINWSPKFTYEYLNLNTNKICIYWVKLKETPNHYKFIRKVYNPDKIDIGLPISKENTGEYLRNKARCIRKDYFLNGSLKKESFIQLMSSNDHQIINYELFKDGYTIEGYQFIYREKTRPRLMPIEHLSLLLQNNDFSVSVIDYDNPGKFKHHDIEKGLFLSWYGPNMYQFKSRTQKFIYRLSDQNEVALDYGVGECAKQPKSFPILIEYY